MAYTSPDRECTAITIREPDVVFNRLTSAIGAAVVAGHELEYAIHIETAPHPDPRLTRWFGGVILQAADDSVFNHPAMKLRVYGERDGAYAERAAQIDRWDLRTVIKGITAADNPPKELSTDAILERAHAIINAIPVNNRITPEWDTSSTSRGMVALSSAPFNLALGKVLSLADPRTPYQEVMAAANTTQDRERMLGRPNRTHCIRGTANSQNGTMLDFELTHSHSDPYEDIQMVELECTVAISPGKAAPSILRAYDRVRGGIHTRPYRTREVRWREVPMIREVISREPIEQDSIHKLASGLHDPEAYLADFWSHLPSEGLS